MDTSRFLFEIHKLLYFSYEIGCDRMHDSRLVMVIQNIDSNLIFL